MTVTVYIIIATLTVSLLGLLGGLLLLWREKFARSWSCFFISLAAGSILGATFLGLLPEVFEKDDIVPENVFLMILAGILFFFVLEKLLVWHHHAHEDETHLHTNIFRRSLATARPLIIFGDALHNLLDGAVVAIAFITDINLGIITTIAVFIHEIPQEIGDFSLLITSGLSRKWVLLWNLFGALISVLGAVLVIFWQEAFKSIEVPVLGFVIGNFIYLALADLLPTIQHERKLSQAIAQIVTMFLGIGLVWWLGTILPKV